MFIWIFFSFGNKEIEEVGVIFFKKKLNYC
jgi:hypothetical protein